jgi:hypothetical protein
MDTCVLVAASTFYVSDDLNIRLEHPFYQQSMSLVAFVRKQLSSRIGITTRTIERQSMPALQGAIDEEISAVGIDREKDFPIYSFIKNYCEQKLKNISSYLVREPVDEDAVKSNYGYVDRLYAEKTEEAVKLAFIEPRFKKRTEQAPKRFQSVAKWIYREQQKKEDYQLTHLIKKPVEPSDKWILAEAIYLSMLYDKIESEDIVFFIASTDNHFSPKRWTGRTISAQISEAIHKKFNIICDWPQQVEEMADHVLEDKYPSPYER